MTETVMMKRRIQLTQNWVLSFTPPGATERMVVAAVVPGNVLLDLNRQGIAGEIFPCDNLNVNRKWEQVNDWTYRTEFDAPATVAGEQVFLVFGGIDTVAEVFLNGERILSCENMFIGHEVEITGRMKASGNRLEVLIKSPSLHARGLPLDNFAVGSSRLDGLVLRKARHMWGWDNAPRLLGAGLWRPVSIEVRPATRLEDVYFHTIRVTNDRVQFGLHYRLTTPDADLAEYRGVLRLALNGQTVREFSFGIGFTAGHEAFSLPRDAVSLWWPRGMGEAVLYDATFTVCRGEELVAEWRQRFGLRDLTLVYTAETTREGDGEFVFVCNGEKVFINGTNWKPLRPTGTCSAEEIRQSLALALDLNCNMIRIWGGGVYEDHDFFDFCDENGLMVWQDFMFACALPPQDDEFQKKVAVEAEWIVKRLRNHPSLAVWCGDNEVDQSFAWGGRPGPRRPSDNVVNRKTLARAVVLFDPHRVYVPSSPFLSDRVVDNAMRGRRPWLSVPEFFSPDDHCYPMDGNFRDRYRQAALHFMSETGPFYISAMSQSADIIARETPRINRLWDTEIARSRYTLSTYQTDDDFLTWKDAARKRLTQQFAREFNPEQWADLALGVNIICGEMFKFAIEWSRCHKWRKTGVLWWSLLDMWPMMFNYSVVDVNRTPKQPCYDWIKQSQQPLCLMIADPAEGELELHVVNDTLRERSGDWRILAVDGAGGETEVCSGAFSVAANSNKSIRALGRPTAAAFWSIQWQDDAGCGKNHFVTGTPPYDFESYKDWISKSGR